MIFIVNKKRKIDGIRKEYPNADILDITSSSQHEYARLLSPFYPHGGIPIPGESHGMTAMSVEGIWQGLKVFQNTGICLESFQNSTMKNLKRTVKRFGKPIGHQYGVYGKEILNYIDARVKIYLPCYFWVLENTPKVNRIVERIKERSLAHDIVFLDYNTNIDYTNIKSPLSHAGLVKQYIEGNYP